MSSHLQRDQSSNIYWVRAYVASHLLHKSRWITHITQAYPPDQNPQKTCLECIFDGFSNGQNICHLILTSKKHILPTTKPRSLGDRRPRGTCQGKAFMGGFPDAKPPNWDNLTLAVWWICPVEIVSNTLIYTPWAPSEPLFLKVNPPKHGLF